MYWMVYNDRGSPMHVKEYVTSCFAWLSYSVLWCGRDHCIIVAQPVWLASTTHIYIANIMTYCGWGQTLWPNVGGTCVLSVTRTVNEDEVMHLLMKLVQHDWWYWPDDTCVPLIPADTVCGGVTMCGGEGMNTSSPLMVLGSLCPLYHHHTLHLHHTQWILHRHTDTLTHTRAHTHTHTHTHTPLRLSSRAIRSCSSSLTPSRVNPKLVEG